jgi:hypothetical protein
MTVNKAGAKSRPAFGIETTKLKPAHQLVQLASNQLRRCKVFSEAIDLPLMFSIGKLVGALGSLE